MCSKIFGFLKPFKRDFFFGFVETFQSGTFACVVCFGARGGGAGGGGGGAKNKKNTLKLHHD